MGPRLNMSIPGMRTGCDSSSSLVWTALVLPPFSASSLRSLDGNALDEIYVAAVRYLSLHNLISELPRRRGEIEECGWAYQVTPSPRTDLTVVHSDSHCLRLSEVAPYKFVPSNNPNSASVKWSGVRRVLEGGNDAIYSQCFNDSGILYLQSAPRPHLNSIAQ